MWVCVCGGGLGMLSLFFPPSPLALLACDRLIEPICLFSDVPEGFTTSQLDSIVSESLSGEERPSDGDGGGESGERKHSSLSSVACTRTH